MMAGTDWGGTFDVDAHTPGVEGFDNLSALI